MCVCISTYIYMGVSIFMGGYPIYHPFKYIWIGFPLINHPANPSVEASEVSSVDAEDAEVKAVSAEGEIPKKLRF